MVCDKCKGNGIINCYNHKLTQKYCGTCDSNGYINQNSFVNNSVVTIRVICSSCCGTGMINDNCDKCDTTIGYTICNCGDVSGRISPVFSYILCTIGIFVIFVSYLSIKK